ncbi:MAG TPA: pitrilysin family protein [Balneolales bacterium]|nr:pitrilysin family protein [Balneolales bacterium]
MEKLSKLDNLNKTTLPSGLRIVSEHIDSVRSISVGVWVKTGSRHEAEKVAGITHFLEHMLFKGTKKRTAFDISSSIEAAGGMLNAFTSSEYTCYYVRCLDTELDTALDVLSDMVMNSQFPDEEIVKEKKVVIEEMKMYRDSPEDFVFEEFEAQVFENHPLGRPIIGYESTVSALQRTDLFDYMGIRYQPWNIIVAVAGNVEHEQVLKLSEHLFSSENKGREEDGKSIMTPYIPQKKILKRPIEQTHYILGKRSISSSDDNRYKLLLMQTILSGGMSSRLHQNIREKYGYCYAIQAFIQSFKDTGMFGVYIGTDKEYLDHVKELILKEFDEIRQNKIPKKELAEAKSQLKGKLLLSQESMSNRMTRLAKSEIIFDRYLTLDELIKHIDEVTADDVRDFAQKFLIDDDLTETILLPEKKN